uniref:Uncharacterized protein n=1 Tax=Glossina austeni TaxID=7395 RepID=A0A1A9V4H5_GLOAU
MGGNRVRTLHMKSPKADIKRFGLISMMSVYMQRAMLTIYPNLLSCKVPAVTAFSVAENESWLSANIFRDFRRSQHRSVEGCRLRAEVKTKETKPSDGRTCLFRLITRSSKFEIKSSHSPKESRDERCDPSFGKHIYLKNVGISQHHYYRIH